MKAANDNTARNRKLEYAKRRRAEAKAQGICGACLKRPRINGKSRCARCYEIFANWNGPWLRKRRAKAVKEGMCATCCARPAQDGLRYCDQCGHWRTVRVQRERERDEWCEECLAAGEHRVDCRKRRAA